MIRPLSYCGSLLLIPALAMASDLNIATRTEIVHQHVSGPGRAASFYDPGAHLLHETELRHSGRLLDGGWNSLLNATLRVTDSPQFDPEKVSVQKLEWKLSDRDTQMHFGDHFANLSPYSLSKGIKGVAFQRNLGDDQNYFRVLYGSFDGQWAFLYQDPAGEPMNRYGGGVRLQRAWEKLRLGFNLVHVEDRDDDPHRAAGQEAFSQVMPAVDWEWREAGLVVSGEHAYADTRRLPAGAAATEPDGSAHKLVLRAALKDLKLDGHVERVSPDFYSLGGGATQDRLRWYLKGDYRLDKEWRAFLIYDDWRDNLADQRATTTETTTWEAGARKARLFGRRNMNLSVSWRNKAVQTSSGSRDGVTDRIKLKLNDRVGQEFDWRAELEHILDDDRVAAADADSILFDFGLGWRRRLESRWDLRANLDLGRQENEIVARNGRDVTDRVRLSFSANRENGTQLGGFYEYTTADLATLGGDNRHNRASLYWQTRPAWLKDGSLKFEFSDYLHTFTEDASRDYREQIVKLSLQWNFARPGRKETKP